MARYRVRELAEAQGLNISELQQQANQITPGSKIAYGTVFAYWHNKTKRPDLDVLTALARVLGVSTGSLIVDEESHEKNETARLDFGKPVLTGSPA